MANKADSRRSTAAQFFLDEEEVTSESKSTYDKVVDLLNHASLLPKEAQKVNSLRQVQELIVNKEPNLLDNFLDEMLAFQHDKSVEVRKFVVGFIEEACKKDHEVLPKVVANVSMMLADDAVAVQKKVIQTSTQLYKVALKWLCTAKSITEIMESTWSYMTQLKARILALVDSENDGIRTHAVKFMEMVVVVQTYSEPDTVKKETDVSLDDVPLNTKILKIRKLEEESKKVFDSLVVFHGSPHISSVNLIACMGSLTLIAKLRPDFMSRVVQALEALQVNLPPTLAKSQVSSVRKQLKVQLISLLKHPSSGDFHPQIVTLLTDLGATQQEINKHLPKPEELKKRPRTDEGGSSSKRIKLEVIEEPDDDKDDDEPPPAPKLPKAAQNTAIDITAEFLVPRLTMENVTDIVLVSMMSLPDTMPAQFQATYTPIAAAGTDAQVKHLSRLFATQLTAAGLGPGVDEMTRKQEEEEAMEEDDASPKHSIQTVVSGSVLPKKKSEYTLLPTGPQQGKSSKRGVVQLKLKEITKPLKPEQMKSMQKSAVWRIMNADKACSSRASNKIRVKVLASLATQFGEDVSQLLEEFIFEDIRNRAELAFSWLYDEYANLSGFSPTLSFLPKPSVDKYDRVLCSLLTGLLQRPEHKERDHFFHRLFLESPVITVNAVEILKKYCQDETRTIIGTGLLKDLIIKRPPKQLDFINVLLELTTHEKNEIRNQAINVVKQLHERGEFRTTIEDYTLMYLKFLLLPEPPSILFGENKGRPVATTVWTDDISKVCLYLYLTLLPINHKLIHDLAQVYVTTTPNVKRIILRVVETPVKGMGMNSPELLTLVEDCPKGAETLVTRVIHILTDKSPPSAELVARVRDLYHKRVPDVRFLIPVLNGLSKKEVVAALPKLIQLNPVVVKEVFNRLLGGHGDSGANYTSPLTPAELLIALHNIDATKCDMKTIMKATSLCFGEKNIYTQEVLAVVMQQLMEQNPLPTLLMRTVLQSLSLYPRLLGFVMNILQRLIIKQVWKQKKVWEGFIKCCQRTKPQSSQVLLRLPAPQLKDVLDTSPDLKEPLVEEINSYTEHQRAFIPKGIMSTIMGTECPPGDEETPVDIVQVIQKPSEIKEEPIDVPLDEPAPPGVN